MNTVALIYSQDFKKLDFGESHPMRGDRYKKALAEFKSMGLLENLIFKEPILISENIIRLFHDPEYIEKVIEVSETGKGYYGEEVPGMKGIYGIILLSVRASNTAADSILGENQCGVEIYR